MPERRFGTTYWSDSFVMKLPLKAKLLYAYLWTNLHCNQAGLYEIAPETISFETGIPLEEVPELLCILEPKVAWYPDQNLVWVKNFLRHQTRSPQFLISAAKCLEGINNNGLVREFIEYNQRHTLSIPYQYPIDTLSIGDSDTHTLSLTNTGTKTVKGVVKGEKQKKTTTTNEDKKPDENKRAFGELSNVKLTPKEYDKLVARLGAQEATRWIDELSLAKASKGYKSKSDYATVLAWERRERNKGGTSGVDKKHTGAKEPTRGFPENYDPYKPLRREG